MELALLSLPDVDDSQKLVIVKVGECVLSSRCAVPDRRGVGSVAGEGGVAGIGIASLVQGVRDRAVQNDVIDTLRAKTGDE